jgi:hypothetical protein
MPLRKSVWGYGLLGLVVIGCVTGVAVFRASTNDENVVLIRCVDYEQPMVSIFESGKPGKYPRESEPFDVHISPSRGVGWWHGFLLRTDESHPAKLLMDVDYYELIATGYFNGTPVTERVYLNRVTGTMGNYLAEKGNPLEELRRGGTCSKLESKF